MNKVIELGKVSQETKGVAGTLEHPGTFFQGPKG